MSEKYYSGEIRISDSAARVFISMADLYEPECPESFEEEIYALFKDLYCNYLGGEATTAFYLYKNNFRKDWDEALWYFDECDALPSPDISKKIFGVDKMMDFLEGNDAFIEHKSCLNKKTYLMIDAHTNLVKIGKSKEPKLRERTLQSAKPLISLFAVCQDDVESLLHKTYKFYRVRGEWFNLSKHQIDEIIIDFNFEIFNTK